MDWRNIYEFPKANGEWQYFRPPFRFVIDGFQNVERAVSHCHTFDTVLVSTPESETFLPPVCVPELCSRTLSSIIRQRKLQIIYSLSCMGILTLLYFFSGLNRDPLLSLTAIVVIFLLFFVVDYYLVVRDPKSVQERSLYMASLYLGRNGHVRAGIVLLLSAGSMQYLYQENIAGLEALVREYGLMRDFDVASEWWRLIVGPFIHSGAFHWFNNLVFIVVSLGLAASFTRRPLLLFLFFTICSALLFRFVPYPGRPEALVGVSGGISALFGLNFYYALLHRDLFPRYHFVTLGMFILLLNALPPLLNPDSSEFSHVAGLATGFAFGGISEFWRKLIPAGFSRA